ncbi:MAG: hypothetical protein ACI35S_06050 [Anaeroplasma sp.]
MEQNKFESLEEVEVTETKETQEEEVLKEYEKLLIAETNRETYDKAINLVKFGCFEQKKEDNIDYSDYEIIDTKKKFKGLYNLYRNLETFQLVFICPLVENNKGDAEENKEMKPYAYDCIYIESMDQETYEMVCKAAKNNISNIVTIGYKVSWVSYFILLAITLFIFLYNLITSNNTFFANIFAALFYSASFIVGCVVGLPILILLSIKFKKYKEQ